MRVILIEPPTIRPLSESQNVECNAPIGLLYLAASLQENSHEVKVLDAFVEGYHLHKSLPNDEVFIGLSFEDIVKEIQNFEADVVGISALFYFNLPTVVSLCNHIKSALPDLKIVLGGTPPTVMFEEIIKETSIDFIIRKEGEYIFPELLSCLDSPGEVKGVVWKNNGRVVINPDASYPKDLDALPLPNRDLVDLYKYIRIEKPHGHVREKKNFASIVTSRGCPFSCSFCSAKDVHGRKIRYRNAENVLNEIDLLVNKYDIDEIHVVDENFSFDRQRAMDIMDGLISRGYSDKISWTCPNGLMIDSLDEQMIDKMQASNCHSVALAFESGDQDVLRRLIKKPLNLKHGHKIVKYFQENTNILLTGFFLIGFPGETKKQIAKTINFANNLNLDFTDLSILIPYPYTRAYDVALSKGYLRNGSNGDYHKLLPRQANIQTEDFTSRWITSIKEADRFLSLIRKKKRTLWFMIGDLFKRNGLDTFRMLIVILQHFVRNDISGDNYWKQATE